MITGKIKTHFLDDGKIMYSLDVFKDDLNAIGGRNTIGYHFGLSSREDVVRLLDLYKEHYIDEDL